MNRPEQVTHFYLASRLTEDITSKASLWASRWAQNDRKSVGCYEAIQKDNPGVDNYESPINRRVEILLFGEKLLEKPLCTASLSVSNSVDAQSRVDTCRSSCRIYNELKDSFDYI